MQKLSCWEFNDLLETFGNTTEQSLPTNEHLDEVLLRASVKLFVWLLVYFYQKPEVVIVRKELGRKTFLFTTNSWSSSWIETRNFRSWSFSNTFSWSVKFFWNRTAYSCKIWRGVLSRFSERSNTFSSSIKFSTEDLKKVV